MTASCNLRTWCATSTERCFKHCIICITASATCPQPLEHRNAKNSVKHFLLIGTNFQDLHTQHVPRMHDFVHRLRAPRAQKSRPDSGAKSAPQIYEFGKRARATSKKRVRKSLPKSGSDFAPRFQNNNDSPVKGIRAQFLTSIFGANSATSFLAPKKNW